MTVLQKQFQSCEQSAQQVAHDQAMFCREVDDLTGVCLALFSHMKRKIDEWQEQVSSGELEFSETVAAGWHETYITADKAFTAVFDNILRAEQLGFAVEGAADFRIAHHEIRQVLSLPVEQIRRSVEELDSGKFRPLREVMRELRSRHQP